MTSPLRTLFAPLALAVLASPALAEAPRLYVVAPSGNIYSAPPDTGVFSLEASAPVPLHSVVQVGGDLWLGSPTGAILRFDLATGAIEPALSIESDLNALVAHGGGLLAAGTGGTVFRIDTDSGQAVELLDAGQPVTALTVDGDTLWAGSPDGDFLRADLSAGTGFELSGVAGGPIQSMGQTATELYLGASKGNVFVYDKLSEVAIYDYPVDGDATAIVRDGNNFLIGGSNGLIHRVVQVFGNVLETFVAPEPVAAMWLEQPLGTLAADMAYVGSFTGGQVTFELSVPNTGGGQLYLLLGSLAGTDPGVSAGSLHLNLNPDLYFSQLLSGVGQGWIDQGAGAFDAHGKATATLTVPPGSGLSLAGAKVHHAFVVLDPLAPELLVGASDPVVLFIL